MNTYNSSGKINGFESKCIFNEYSNSSLGICSGCQYFKTVVEAL